MAVACSMPQSVDLPALRMPRENVPDAKRAAAIAVIAFNQVYGRDETDSGRAYVAQPVDDFWFVHGTLPEGALGGTAVAVIDRHTGQFRCLSREE